MKTTAQCSPLRESTLIRKSTLVMTFLTFLVMTATAMRGPIEPYRAHLSADLVAYEARQTGERTRVIVQGASSDIETLAARHHLAVVRHLNGAAVVMANSAELTEVAADEAAASLSGDADDVNGLAAESSRYSGSGRPLVSSPNGIRSRPNRNAIDVRATGMPIVPK